MLERQESGSNLEEGSVEIPDAAVQKAAQVYWETEGNRAVCMRAALVAARPYLMPTEDEIGAAITKAVAEYRGHLVFDGLGSVAAAAVLALLNGEIKKGEDR